MNGPPPPVGAPFWWHLAHEEQHEYMRLTSERQQLLHRVKLLERERGQLRELAHVRCRHAEEHLHSMTGIVTDFQLAAPSQPPLNEGSRAAPRHGLDMQR